MISFNAKMKKIFEKAATMTLSAAMKFIEEQRGLLNASNK